MDAAGIESGPWTVGRLLGWTRGFLDRRGLDSPRLCAEMLLAHAMSCERIRLYTQFETVPGEDILERFRASVREAAAGKPIAYLTGIKEFYSLVFEVTPDVLIPRPETELLVERAISFVREAGQVDQRILDLGTGSGCIAVTLAKYLPEARITASDVSAAALEIARRNAVRHGVAERIAFVEGDAFKPWQGGSGGDETRFDFIVGNPPYVSTEPDAPVEDSVRRYEPAVALFAGSDGLDFIRRLIAEAPAHLRPGGRLLLEIGFDQAAAVRGLLRPDIWADMAITRDAGGHERVVQARLRDDAAS